MVGDRIRKIREDKKMGLNETAKSAGISGSYLSNIEKGIKSNPSTETLQKIAAALGVFIDEFFKEDSPKTDVENLDIPQEYTDKYKVTKKDLKQRDEVINHAQAFMMDDKVSETDKERLFEIVNKLYWKSKSNNKEKYGKNKGDK